MLFRLGSLSVEFNVWNPLYALAPFVLLTMSVPLAVFATITTTMAILLLSLRASIVYFQLTIALAGAWINPAPSKASLYRAPPTPLSGQTSPHRHRNAHSSSGSAASSQDTIVRPPNTGGAYTPLHSTSEMTRDFEGVGGWRLPGDDDEEALWMGMNSRLQLPADSTTRRHQRSQTGSTVEHKRHSWSPEALRMSPVQSRSRTPARFAGDEVADYFSIPSMSNIRPTSGISEPTKHRRRKSGSGSSSLSNASGNMMVMKESGE